MRVLVEQDGTIQLREVFNSVNFKTAEGELFSVVMRDGGFELEYQGQRYSAKGGKLSRLNPEGLHLNGDGETNEMLQ